MRRIVLAVGLVLPLVGCGSSTGQSYTEEDLARFRAALPAESQLQAATPTSTGTAARALTVTPATFPVLARDTALAINAAVTGMLSLMHALVDVPPTSYDSATREFAWGPWAAGDRFGMVAAYIKEQLPVAKSSDCPSGYHVDPADAASCVPDFHYVYVLARGLNEDPSTFTAVIWGGANPDALNPTHGSGVILWDFEADYAFAAAAACSAPTPPTPCDDSFATTDFTRGRFVTLYGKGFTEDTTDPAESTFAFDVAVFRDFVPSDNPTADPVDAEYFYGVYDSTYQVGFLNLHTTSDIETPPDGDVEDLEVRVAHLYGGSGRAEITATCPPATSCSLGAGQADLIECWNPLLLRTFLSFDGPQGTFTVPADATEAACGLVFQNSLDALHIPTLDSIDPALLGALENVASNGMP